jgi:prophage regulatory protein
MSKQTRRFLDQLNEESRGPLPRETERYDSAAAARTHYRLLSRDDLRARGIMYSRVHLDRLMKEGKFPRCIALGENRKAWIESEIDQFIARKIVERDQNVA